MIEINKGSCIGKYHLKNKIPNQDYCLTLSKKDCVFAVMADGVSLVDSYGTISNSHIASKRLCKSALIYFEHLYHMNCMKKIDLLNAIYTLCRKDLQEYIKSNDLDPNYYHSTFIITLFKDDTLYYVYTGDSGIIGIYDQKPFCITDRNKNQLYVDSILNVKKPMSGIKKVDSYILLTDGIYQATLKNYSGNGFDNRLLNDILFNHCTSKKLVKFLNELPPFITNDDKSVIVIKTNKFKNIQFDENKAEKTNDIQSYFNAIKAIKY